MSNSLSTPHKLNPLQLGRAISISAALLIGFWIPTRLLGMRLWSSADTAFDLMVSAVSLVNVYLHFRERDELAWRKLKSWLRPGLLADLVCVLPLSVLDHYWIHSPNQSLVLLNLLAARHIWRIKAFLDEFAGLPPIVYRLVPIGLMMPLLVHLVACGWIALGSGTAGPDPDRFLEYVRAIYWAFTTLTTVGYGDISAKTPPQMLYCCVVQLLGVGVFGFVVSNVASLLSRLDAAREHHIDSVDKIETYMRSHGIPHELRAKVRGYYHYLWKNHKGYQDQTLLQDLPAKMQSEMFFHINRSIIEKVPFLQGADQDLLEDLMNALKPRIFVPGERIFHFGEPGDAMYFIQSGKVDILGRNQQRVARLENGSYFGEMALVTQGNRSATARAETYTSAYVLKKESFEQVIAAYPEFREHVEQTAQQRKEEKAS